MIDEAAVREAVEALTPRARSIIGLAASTARSLGHDWVGVEHIFAAILDEADNVARLFLSRDHDIHEMRRGLESFLKNPQYLSESLPDLPSLTDP